MHILLVHQYFLNKSATGGTRFNELVDHWNKKGVKVTVIAGKLDGTGWSGNVKEEQKFIYKEEDTDKLQVYRCWVSPGYNKSFFSRLISYFSFVFSSIICGLFYCRNKYDLVLVTSPPLFLGFTGVVLKWLKGIPLLFEVRDLWPESAVSMGIMTNKTLVNLAYWLERFTYRQAKVINVLTPAFERKIIEKGIPKEKIIQIPNACDFRMADKIDSSGFDREALRLELGWQGKFVIIYVGAHGKANHLIQVLDAAKLLEDINEIMFALVGSGPEKENLKKEAQNRTLGNIAFYDSMPKKEVLKMVKAADVGASVLKANDTFKTIYSNKTFDYMSCKKPILLVIDGVSRELVETAGCGIFAEPENPEDISKKAYHMYQMKGLLSEQGQRGYVYGKKHFDRAKLADEYLGHLQNMVGKNSSKMTPTNEA